MRGQRRRSPQASTTTARAASRCQPAVRPTTHQPLRQSHCAPGPPPSTGPHPAAKPVGDRDRARNRATDASRNTPTATGTQSARATVAPLTASTWRAAQAQAAAAPRGRCQHSSKQQCHHRGRAHNHPGAGVAKGQQQAGQRGRPQRQRGQRMVPRQGRICQQPQPHGMGHGDRRCRPRRRCARGLWR